MMEEGRSEDIILMDRRRRIGLGQRLEKLILSISYVERVPYHRGESDIPLSACRCRTTMHLPRGNNHRLVACAFIHFAASCRLVVVSCWRCAQTSCAFKTTHSEEFDGQAVLLAYVDVLAGNPRAWRESVVNGKWREELFGDIAANPAAFALSCWFLQLHAATTSKTAVPSSPTINHERPSLLPQWILLQCRGGMFPTRGRTLLVPPIGRRVGGSIGGGGGRTTTSRRCCGSVRTASNVPAAVFLFFHHRWNIKLGILPLHRTTICK